MTMHTIEKRGFWAVVNVTIGVCAFKSLMTDTSAVNEVINLMAAIAGLGLGLHYIITKIRPHR